MPDTSFAHPPEDLSRRAALCRLLEAHHALVRANRFFVQVRSEGQERFSADLLSRMQKRVDILVELISALTKDFQIVGIDKKTPFVEVGGDELSLHEISRRVREIQTNLRAKKATDPVGDIVDALTDPPPGEDPNAIHPTGFWAFLFVAIAKAAVAVASGATNDTTDDKARALVSHALPEDIERMTDDSIVKLLNDLLDGSTGDDDERAILKILRALTNRCDRMSTIVRRAGLDKLLWSVDGEEWDEMVIILLKCGIINFAMMDDDASRLFVDRHTYAQLSHLHIEAVHQLVLNMFDGSCGDEDEDAILKLVGSQVAPKLQQLVSMPGTDVGAFDHNFDGEQWDRLEMLFAANGIELDP